MMKVGGIVYFCPHNACLLPTMDDPSLLPININILHNYTLHNTSNTAKSSFRKKFRAETLAGDKKRVTFPSEGIVFECVF